MDTSEYIMLGRRGGGGGGSRGRVNLPWPRNDQILRNLTYVNRAAANFFILSFKVKSSSNTCI